MPFGKHQGRELSAIPADYLEWLLTLPNLRAPLKRGITKELQCREQREQQSYSNHSDGIPTELQPICRDIVDHGYRAVSKHVHPDTGGDHESMVLLNKAIERLRRICGGA